MHEIINSINIHSRAMAMTRAIASGRSDLGKPVRALLAGSFTHMHSTECLKSHQTAVHGHSKCRSLPTRIVLWPPRATTQRSHASSATVQAARSSYVYVQSGAAASAPQMATMSLYALAHSVAHQNPLDGPLLTRQPGCRQMALNDQSCTPC
jgi:hypothetical protein